MWSCCLSWPRFSTCDVRHWQIQRCAFFSQFQPPCRWIVDVPHIMGCRLAQTSPCSCFCIESKKKSFRKKLVLKNSFENFLPIFMVVFPKNGVFWQIYFLCFAILFLLFLFSLFSIFKFWCVIMWHFLLAFFCYRYSIFCILLVKIHIIMT